MSLHPARVLKLGKKKRNHGAETINCAASGIKAAKRISHFEAPVPGRSSVVLNTCTTGQDPKGDMRDLLEVMTRWREFQSSNARWP